MDPVRISHPTDRPNYSVVTVGDLVLTFSYETVIAFYHPSTGWAVSENRWGPTTGKHLNYCPGRKSDRLPRAEFENRLAEFEVSSRRVYAGSTASARGESGAVRVGLAFLWAALAAVVIVILAATVDLRTIPHTARPVPTSTTTAPAGRTCAPTVIDIGGPFGVGHVTAVAYRCGPRGSGDATVMAYAAEDSPGLAGDIARARRDVCPAAGIIRVPIGLVVECPVTGPVLVDVPRQPSGVGSDIAKVPAS